MPEHSNDTNVYKPKFTGFLIAAVLLVLLVVVVLISTIFILSSRSKNPAQTTLLPDNSQNPVISTDGSITTADPVGTDDPSVSTLSPDVTDDPDTPDTPSKTPVKVSPTETQVSVSKEAMNEGSLLMLDSTHGYQKDPSLLITRSAMAQLSADKLLQDYGFVKMTGGTGNYVLAGSNRFANSEAVAYFGEMMKDFAAASGHTDVQVRNAYYYTGVAGDEESVEHATGYYLDLEIFRTGKGTYPLNYETMKSEYYDWFIANCWKYGFVHVRDIDRSDEKYSTFRFVGAAHAAVMNKYKFDLSQYLSAITVYTYENRMKITDGYGWEWWVYYVKSSGDNTSIPVIGNEHSYRISGNNLNGYVVAINSSCFS